MKRVIILLTGILIGLTSLAQNDSTQTQSDTIRIGSMIIIKRAGKDDKDQHGRHSRIIYRRVREEKPSNVSTNWIIVDLGFTNYNDKTNYNGPGIQDPQTGFAPGANKDWFKLRAMKSSNVNLWLFMQRVNLIKHVVNLKYGLGVELNNYRYDEPIRFATDPTRVTLDNSTSYKKNKLAADYVTAPLMLNFNFTPKSIDPHGFSIGVSAGYLYSGRQKTITAAEGKKRKRDDFDLRPWKVSYVAELTLGFVKFYGSYATESMFEKGLDQTPYTFGFRLSNW